MTVQITKKTIPLRGLSVSVQDVRRIIERLIRQVEEEGGREVARLLENGPSDSEHRDQVEAGHKQAFRVTVTITGKDGEALFGYGIEPFDSPDIPEPIESIYISNISAYQNVFGRNPVNYFTLNFDFSTPPLVDNNNPVSNPTPNSSTFIVEGDQDAWVGSVQQTVTDVLSKKSNGRAFMHAAFVYDIGLALLGLPAAIYLCWRLGEIVQANLGIYSPFLAAAAYIYVFFLVANIYRVLFGYTKWAFPTVELIDNKGQSKTHRKFWFGIMLSIVASAIYDFLD